MNNLEQQFRRLERTFEKVLDNRDRDPLEYEDDIWCFFQTCWHLKDWIQNDGDSVPKNVRKRVEKDVESFWKLVLIGDLTNRSRRLKLNDKETDSDIKNRELRITTATAKTRWVDGIQETDKGNGETVLVVADNMGLEYPVRDLAKDAMRIWHTLFKLYGLNHLLKAK